MEWGEVRLGDFSTMKYGKMPDKENLKDSGYPIFSGYRIVGYTDKYHFDEPQLVVVARGVGGTGDVKLSPPKAFLTNLCISLSLDEKIADKKYLYYYFKHHSLRHLDSGSAQSQITIADLQRYKLLLPLISEQKRIAHILGSLDDKIELNRKMNETLEAMARALFKSWFIDFDPVHAKAAGKKPFGMDDATAALFPDSFVESELGLIPRGWGVLPLYEIAEWQNGMSFKDIHFTSSNKGIPIIKISELKNGLTAQTKKSCQDHDFKFRIDNGHILFSWSGSPDTSIDTFVWNMGPAWLNQHIFRVSPKKTTSSWMYFLLKFLKPNFIDIARNKQTTGLGHVTVNDLKKMYCCIPDEDILNIYEKKWSHNFKLISSSLKENESMTETRNFLLPHLLSEKYHPRMIH